MIKVMGIDPGLASTGVGIVFGSFAAIDNYSFGSINTSKYDIQAVRLNTIYTKLLDLLKKEKPEVMVVEDVFIYGKNPKSGIILGKVLGIILLAGNRSGVPVVELPVKTVKKIITGNGSASKNQLEMSVRRILKHSCCIRPDHASDALGLALAGLFRYEKKTDSYMK